MRNFHLDSRAGPLALEMMQGDPDQLFDTKELSKLMGVSRDWLNIGRTEGYGPPYIKVASRSVRYRRSDLVKWLDGRTFRNTTEARHAEVQ